MGKPSEKIDAKHNPFVRNPDLEKAASEFYDPKMPYHNFEHIKYVIKAAIPILERCHDKAVEINGEVVYYALLFHDAGYHENHEELGYEAKEEYSADIAEKLLKEHNFEAQFIRKVRKAIISTHRDASFSNIEERAVRAADLAGIADEYGVFKENALNLKKEYELMTSTKVSLNEWKGKVAANIEFYLEQDIHITSDPENVGNSVFHVKARQNLAKFVHEKEEPPATDEDEDNQ